VLVHRPKDLDTASSLAILQEEVLLGYPSMNPRKTDFNSDYKQATQMGFSGSIAKGSESASHDKRVTNPGKRKVHNEKLVALMAYRKAKGLCFKCGIKWGPQHKCPDSVSLNVVEELWQMLAEEVMVFEKEDSDSGDDPMALSAAAIEGTNSGKTIKLAYSVLHHKAIALVDFGSSHSFISEALASQLPNWKPLKKPIQVKVANGSILLCTHELVDCKWMTQGVQFQTTFRILPLTCYDAILGMDWLEQHSPMNVQWAQKQLSFCHAGAQV